MKLNIAGGLNLPEYVFGDASNANYASSLVAEAPFVKAVEYWQISLEFWFKKLYKKVINNAVAGNVLTEPDDQEFLRRLRTVNDLQEIDGQEDGKADGMSPKEQALKDLMPNGKVETPTEIFYGCDMQWPEIIHRDQKAFTESLQLARTAGWVSDQTASSALGWDFNEEVRKQKNVEDEAELTGNPLLGIKSGEEKEASDDGEMDDEINSVIASLTDKEKQDIIAKTDPKEIANILMAKTNGNGGGQNGSSKVGTSIAQ
jgi:hypothetical protein